MSILTKLCNRFCKPKQVTTYVPSTPDSRDFISGRSTAGLPSSVDLRPWASVRVLDQSWSEGCTGMSAANTIDIILDRQGSLDTISPLYLWANGRRVAGDMNNVGIQIRDLLKGMVKYGVALESEYPFDLNKIKDVPGVPAALDRKVLRYEFCGAMTDASLMQIKAQLTAGVPVLLGLMVNRNLSNLKTFLGYVGIQNQPGWTGHAVTVVGYDDAAKHLIIENSWGPQFGENGFFALPYSVYRTDSYEAWTITSFSFTKPLPVVEVESRGSRIYLEGDQNFRVSSPNCKVYGSAGFDSVILDRSATDTTLDGNIDEIQIPWMDDPRFRQSGNVLEIFDANYSRNGPLIAKIPYNERPLTLVFSDKKQRAVTIGQGGIQIDGKPVATITPEAV